MGGVKGVGGRQSDQMTENEADEKIKSSSREQQRDETEGEIGGKG